MSKSTHQIAVRTKDETAAGFNAIAGRAKATGAQIKSVLGGALAAAGAYLGFRQVVDGINELGKLSDIAMKTSTTTDELTRMSAAMGALGIQNMGIDQIAKSFDYMSKTTGRSGMEGFYQTIQELGKIEDVATRSQMAMQIFGQSGMEFMPLINGADETVNALQTVVNAMPAIPQSAANAGDAVADAMDIASKSVKSIWLQGLGTICGWFDQNYAGGIREAALSAGNALEYYTKVAVSRCITLYEKLKASAIAWGESIGAVVGAATEKLFGTGGSWADVFATAGNAWDSAWSEYDDKAAEIEALEEERTNRWANTFAEREVAISKFQAAYDKAAVSIKKRQSLDLGKVDGGVKSATIRNQLMLGGSNEANRAAVIGPQMNEAKKQTDLLTKIAENTKKSADASDDVGDSLNLEVT